MTYSLETQPIAAVPVFHWRGARPFPLDLSPAETGTATLLLLTRQGNACLLPLAWDRNLDPVSDHTTLPLHAQALDLDAFKLTLAELRGDGWHVYGRVDIRFAGEFTLEQFWPTVHALLWQPPGGTHGVHNGNPLPD